MCKDLIDNYRDLFNVTKEELDREEAIMRKTENFNRNPNPVKVSRIRISKSLTELIGSLKLGNVWVFVQLVFCPRWPMNQVNKNPNIS